MAADARPVVLMGWATDREATPWFASYMRRTRVLRELVTEHLDRRGIAHRTELVPRTGQDPDAARTAIERLAGTPGQVVITVEWDLEGDDLDLLTHMHHQGELRTLVLTTNRNQGPLPTITCHQAATGNELARHCLANGFRKLLYLSPFTSPWSDARGDGVALAGRAAGIPVHVEPSANASTYVVHRSQPEVVQRMRLRVCLERGLRVLGAAEDEHCAVIAANDRVALAARALLPAFPGGWAGFDDEPAAGVEQLTSARLPLARLAEHSAALAERMVRGEDLPGITEVPWELMARASTSRLRTTARSARPAAVRRIAVSSEVSAHHPPVEPCAPVVVIGMGEVPVPSNPAEESTARLVRGRNTCITALSRAGIAAESLAISPEADPPTIARRVVRAVQRAIDGGARVVILQDLSLAPEPAALLTQAEGDGRLYVMHLAPVPPTDGRLAVAYDQGGGGALATTHCLNQGYRHLLWLAPFAAEWVDERGRAARRALLLTSGLQPGHMVASEPTTLACHHWLALPETARLARLGALIDAGLAQLANAPGGAAPTAILACSDPVAFDVLTLFTRRGITPGRDLGLIGFDNGRGTEGAGLTSLAPPVEAMGEEAARLVRSLLAGQQVPASTRLPWTLLARASTRRE